jgi:hypothetical protein
MLTTKIRTIIIAAVVAVTALSVMGVASADTKTGRPTDKEGKAYCIVAVHEDGRIDYAAPGSTIVTETKDGKRTTYKCEDGSWVQTLTVGPQRIPTAPTVGALR